MHRPARSATFLAVGAFLFIAPQVASAQQVVDEYSGVAPVVVTRDAVPAAGSPEAGAPGVVTQRSVGGPATVTSPRTLPFTGGEVVLAGALGAGAVVGGVLLVAAGRRRSHA